jgi:tetratricopeptide (TPR) repeat protein
MQVASGLAAAHAQGLVHRDVKPANILLEKGALRVKITDFGLARAVDDSSLTSAGTLVGTPNFMSPEQARGDPVDRTTDLFSLASVLYAICTGRPPFRADSTVAVLRKVSDDAPPPIGELNPDVPEWPVAIISRLMAKAPAQRFQSATELYDVLATHLAERGFPSQPGSSPPVAPSVAEPKSVRKIGVTASMLGLTATAIGFLTWWSVHSWDRMHSSSMPLVRVPAPSRRPDSPPPQPSTVIAQAVTRDPVMSQTFSGLAADAAKKREQQRALALYAEAIGRDPENVTALLGRASISSSYVVADWAGAIADTSEVIRIDPRNAEAYELRARARIRSQAFRAAIDDATEAIHLDPSRPEAYVVRGTAYNGLGEWSHAIVDLDGVIRRDPAWCWNWFERASALLGLGNLDRALSDINRAIQLDKNINQFWYLRARIHTSKDDYPVALADLTEGIRASPPAERDLDPEPSRCAGSGRPNRGGSGGLRRDPRVRPGPSPACLDQPRLVHRSGRRRPRGRAQETGRSSDGRDDHSISVPRPDLRSA